MSTEDEISEQPPGAEPSSSRKSSRNPRLSKFGTKADLERGQCGLYWDRPDVEAMIPNSYQLSISVGGLSFSRTYNNIGCARSLTKHQEWRYVSPDKKQKESSSIRGAEEHGAGIDISKLAAIAGTGIETEQSTEQSSRVTTSRYMVLGIFNRASSIPNERLVYLDTDGDLRRAVHSATVKLLGWTSLLSLKRIASFGVYECNPRQGFHKRVDVDPLTEATLKQLYLDYKTKDLPMYKWIDWVSKNMNEFHKIPSEGRYSLELKLSWSAKKIMVLVTTPVILSLVIGTWYMQSTGDTQTAWTIASYIVTAAEVIIALLAVLTQIGGI